MRDRKFNPNERHSDDFYFAVLNILIAGNRDNLSYQAMAQNLNDLGIPTSAGLTWTAMNVKGVLRKLRLYKEFPSKIHQSLLVLIFENRLSLKETLPLFKSRLHGIQ